MFTALVYKKERKKGLLASARFFAFLDGSKTRPFSFEARKRSGH
jgi:hypothetical protein